MTEDEILRVGMRGKVSRSGMDGETSSSGMEGEILRSGSDKQELVFKSQSCSVSRVCRNDSVDLKIWEFARPMTV